MGKFEVLFFTVTALALLSGTGAFNGRSHSRRNRLAAAGSGRYHGPLGDQQAALSGPRDAAPALRLACVDVTDERGERLYEAGLPASVQLPRVGAQSCGSSDFLISLAAAYDDLYSDKLQQVVLRSVPNGWYLCGQFIFGVRVGWIVFDPERGSLYHLEQAQLDRARVEDPGVSDEPSNASFVLLDDVPESLRAAMTPLDSL